MTHFHPTEIQGAERSEAYVDFCGRVGGGWGWAEYERCFERGRLTAIAETHSRAVGAGRIRSARVGENLFSSGLSTEYATPSTESAAVGLVSGTDADADADTDVDTGTGSGSDTDTDADTDSDADAGDRKHRELATVET
jgi:hypothetical protein